MNGQSVAVVGAGIAGVQVTEELRRRGYTGRIDLISSEAHLPYDRPPLSKDYLTSPDAAAVLLHPPGRYADLDVVLRLGTHVRQIDPADRSLTLDDGGRLHYTDVVLAVGSRARTLPWLRPADNIVYLRTLDDATRLRQILTPGARVVVAGGGFIGLEIAAAARTVGAEVAIVEMAPEPLSRILGNVLGGAVGDLHRTHGVTLHTNETVAAACQAFGDSVLITSTGRHLPYDALVVGVGAEPADEIASRAGIAVNSGILVDRNCRTSAPHVYAIGDVARHDHPVFGPLRVEHWDSARKQAAAAAATIVGEEEPCTWLPWFWSDQYDINFQYIGHAEHFDDIVIRGDVVSSQFTAFYCLNGQVRAAFGAGRPRDIRPAGRLIFSGAIVPASVLADQTADLRRLTAVVGAAESGGTHAQSRTLRCPRALHRFMSHPVAATGPCR